MWAPSSHCHDVMWWCHLGICSACIHHAFALHIGISLFSNCIHWSAIPVAIRITDIFHTPHFACNRHSTQLFLRKVQHSVQERVVMAMVGKLVGYNIWHVILIKRDNRISLSNKLHHTESKTEELTTSSSSSYLKQKQTTNGKNSHRISIELLILNKCDSVACHGACECCNLQAPGIEHQFNLE